MNLPVGDSATQGNDFKALADLAVSTLAEHGIKAHRVQFNSGYERDSIQVVVVSRWNPDVLEVYARERVGSGHPTRALAACTLSADIPDGGVEDAVRRAAHTLAWRYKNGGWPEQPEMVESEKAWMTP